MDYSTCLSRNVSSVRDVIIVIVALMLDMGSCASLVDSSC
jgi:hypothetical protein